MYFCVMRFLRNTDYYRLIQPNDLDALLLSANDAGYDGNQLLIDSENTAIEIIKNALCARFDLDRIFTDTPIYSSGTTYYGQNRVQYHEAEYNSSSTYAVGNRVSYNNNIYECNTNGTTGTWNAAKWNFICLDYALFYANIPNSEFQSFTNYLAGTTVWFSDNYTYTALRNTNGQSLNNAVFSEYGADKTVPYDGGTSQQLQDVSNTVYWRKNSIYSFSNTLPTDGTKWTQGDNRSQLIVEKVIDIALFNLFTSISPRNIPEVRLIRYDGNDRNQNGGAMGWLKKVALGEIPALLPQKYPVQGIPFVFGTGAPKQQNTY